MNPVHLRFLQKSFEEFLRKPALEKQHNRTDLIENKSQEDCSNRLGTYRRAFRNRLLSSLRSDFPKTVNALGDRAKLYLLKYITEGVTASWTLAEAGNGLPAFLRKKLCSDDFWIADIAEFELTLIKLEASNVLPIKKDLITLNSTLLLRQLNLVCPDDSHHFLPAHTVKPLIFWSLDNKIFWEEIDQVEYDFFDCILNNQSLEETVSRLGWNDSEIEAFFIKWTAKNCILGLTT